MNCGIYKYFIITIYLFLSHNFFSFCFSLSLNSCLLFAQANYLCTCLSVIQEIKSVNQSANHLNNLLFIYHTTNLPLFTYLYIY